MEEWTSDVFDVDAADGSDSRSDNEDDDDEVNDASRRLFGLTLHTWHDADLDLDLAECDARRRHRVDAALLDHLGRQTVSEEEWETMFLGHGDVCVYGVVVVVLKKNLEDDAPANLEAARRFERARMRAVIERVATLWYGAHEHRGYLGALCDEHLRDCGLMEEHEGQFAPTSVLHNVPLLQIFAYPRIWSRLSALTEGLQVHAHVQRGPVLFLLLANYDDEHNADEAR